MRAVVLLALAAVIAGCSSSNPASSPISSARKTPEHELAIIERKGPVGETDPLVASFGRALDALQEHCPDPRERLADYVVNTHTQLAKADVTESHLRCNQQVAASIPARSSLTSCSDAFTVYALARTGQKRR